MARTAVALLTTFALLAVPGAASAATITPSTTDDEYDEIAPFGDCSLREAIQASMDNAAFGGCPAGDAGLDVITLTGPAANEFQLSTGGFGENFNEEGDLDISGSGGAGPILIRGNSTSPPAQITIETTVPMDRIFDLRGSSADLRLDDLVIDGGDITGAIEPEDKRGGAIAVRSTSSLTMTNSTILGGQALSGGGLYYAGDSQVNISDSRIEGNTAEDGGGGIFSVSGGSATATLNRVVIDDNETVSTDPGDLFGGGVSIVGAGFNLLNSALTNNTVHNDAIAGSDAFGGGIHTTSPITIAGTLIAGNHAIAENNDGLGGGVAARLGSAGEAVVIRNSTIYDNTAGDLSHDGFGAGVYQTDNLGLSLAHVTFAINAASAGGGGDHIGGDAGAGDIALRASIVPGTSLFVDLCGSSADVNSTGFNVTNYTDVHCGLVGTDSVGGPTGTAGGAPVPNGGFANSIALVLGGRAANLVPAAECAPAGGTDQRGYPRPLPVGGACDAGAYELHSCDGSTTLNGPFVACPVPPGIAPVATPDPPVKKKCKKPKKKKGKKASTAAKKKKPKGCKKKKRKKRK